MASSEGAGPSHEEIDDVTMSLQGMTYLLNNDWDKANELFSKYKDDSPLMCAGNGMVIFMRALMTFEEEQLENAMKVLQETKKKCESSKNFTLSRLRKSSSKKHKSSAEVEDKLQRQIIVADCVIYQAVLTFLNQDIASYIKGGWMLRKAYKMYEKLYKEIKKTHSKLCQNQATATAGEPVSQSHTVQEPDNQQNTPGDDVEEALELTEDFDQSESASNHMTEDSPNQQHQNIVDQSEASDDNQSANTDSSLINPAIDSTSRNYSTDNFQIEVHIKEGELSREAAERLFGAVSFGFGTFQLVISLVPPKILKIIEFLGFEGDREQGLESLDVASHSKDMKAPLASLGLIWYHTVIRPFFALDGSAVAAGVEEANRILSRSEERYPTSALFLFFKGRAQRLQAKLNESRDTYTTALASCHEQREIQLICYHEIGWIAMLQMDWQECVKCFLKLKEESRWSKSYYAFLTGLSEGAMGNMAAARAQFEDAPELVKRKNNQIEQFVLKRTSRLLKDGARVTREYCTLMLLEVLYLWNALSQCTQQDRQKMLAVCDDVGDQSIFHLKSLISGALHNEMGNQSQAQQYFRDAIARQEELTKQERKDDTHVAAYALYELGIILASEPDTYEEGKRHLLRSRDGYKEYDLDNRLSVRINAALRRLKQEGTPL